MSQLPKTRFSSFSRGTKSWISGARPSVRLPKRIVPSCVSEPTGCAVFRRTKSTPAMNVVATAPIPTVSTPSFPFGGLIFPARRIRLSPIHLDRHGGMMQASRLRPYRRLPLSSELRITPELVHLFFKTQPVEAYPFLILLAPVSLRDSVRSRIDEFSIQSKFCDPGVNHYARARVRHKCFRGRVVPAALMRLVNPTFPNGRTKQLQQERNFKVVGTKQLYCEPTPFAGVTWRRLIRRLR